MGFSVCFIPSKKDTISLSEIDFKISETLAYRNKRMLKRGYSLRVRRLLQ
jgi:hypothetical protein